MTEFGMVTQLVEKHISRGSDTLKSQGNRATASPNYFGTPTFSETAIKFDKVKHMGE